MSSSEIREPIQKRSIEKKEKIIKAGFELICKEGYHNTDTVKIAKKAGVSTGIVYQYFKDKRDIFMAGLEKYADEIFYPMINISDIKFDKENIPDIIKKMIKKYVAYYFYKREMEMTHKIADTFVQNGFDIPNINEKVHIIIGLIDNLCHEVVYHKHKEINYDIMTDIVVASIVNILTNKD